MPSLKINPVTLCYNGYHGDKEHVFACKGRPFSVLTSPNYPTPPATMIDFNLVRDLKLKMTDLQCAKLHYCGEKLRILGRISTTVQCISDGSQAGNMYFKANVVEGLYHKFDTHSIAGNKLVEKLLGTKAATTDEDSSTEPTKKKKKKVKVNAKNTTDAPKIKFSQPASTDDEIVVSDSSDPPPSPRPKCQGKWTKNQYYHGWHPTHGDGRDNLKTCYENRKTGSVTYDTPVEWFSDGSLHSLATVDRDSSDEYIDEYTNISTVRFNDEAEKTAPAAKKTGHDSPVSSTVCDWMLPVPGPPDSFGPARAKLFTPAQLARKKRLFRAGQETPPDLRHVPVPHGADWCDGDCLWEGQDNLPPECGYHPRFGNVKNCSARCPGGWCQHTRQMSGRDYMS